MAVWSCTRTHDNKSVLIQTRSAQKCCKQCNKQPCICPRGTERKNLSWNSWNIPTLCLCGQFSQCNHWIKEFFPLTAHSQLILGLQLYQYSLDMEKNWQENFCISLPAHFMLLSHWLQHNWRWKSSLMLKQVSCLTTLAVTLPPPGTLCWDWNPLAVEGFQWPNGCPTWLPTHLTFTQPGKLPSLVGAQTSHSRVPDISILPTVWLC